MSSTPGDPIIDLGSPTALSAEDLAMLAADPAAARDAWAAIAWVLPEPPDDTEVSVCWTERGSFRGTSLPVADLKRIWAEVDKHVARSEPVWCSIGLMRPVREGRGKAADVRSIGVFVADIDATIAGRPTGAHSAEKKSARRNPLPDGPQGIAYIKALHEVLPLAMVTDTGYGWHAYACVDFADAPMETVRSYMKRWRDVQASIAAQMGIHADAGIAQDPARVLRVPGTFNVKVPEQPQPVRIVYYDPDRTVLTTEDLDARLPQGLPRPAPAATKRSTHATKDRDRDMSDYVEPEHRAWLRHVDPTDMLMALDWEESWDGRLKAPGTSSPTSGQVVDDGEEGWALFVNSETVIADWGLEDRRGESGGVKIRTWTVLAAGYCRGDKALAERIATVHQGDPDGLVEWMHEHADPGTRQAQHALAGRETRLKDQHLARQLAEIETTSDAIILDETEHIPTEPEAPHHPEATSTDFDEDWAFSATVPIAPEVPATLTSPEHTPPPVMTATAPDEDEQWTDPAPELDQTSMTFDDPDSVEQRDLLDATDGDPEAEGRLFLARLATMNNPSTPDEKRVVHIDGDSLYVVLGGLNHGIWSTSSKERDEFGSPKTKQLTNWVAYKSAEVQDADATPGDTKTRMFDVTFLTRRGTRVTSTTVPALEPRDAHSLIRLLEVGPDVVCTSTRGETADAIMAVVRVLGGSVRPRRLIYSQMGTVLLEDGTPAYLAPAGSVGPDGQVDRAPVDIGGMEVETHSTRAVIGWPQISSPEQLRADAGAIRSMIGIAPGRPDIGVALLGQLFAAPMGPNEGGTVVVHGAPDSGKSWALRCLNGFLTRSWRKMLIDLRASSKVGVAGLSSWAIGTLMLADDFRLTGTEKSQDEVAKKALSQFVQASYGASGEWKGKQDGGIRSQRPPRYCAVVSAELLPESVADNTRLVPVQVNKHDIDLEDGAMDHFKEAYAISGAANRLYGHYLSWLMRMIRDADDRIAPDEGNPLQSRVQALWDRSTQTRSEMMKVDLKDNNRAAETVATIRLGWYGLRCWAQDHGLLDLIPDEGEIDAAVAQLLGAASSNNAAVSHPEAIRESLIQAVASGEWWIGDHEGSAPKGWEVECGWRRGTSEMTMWARNNSASQIGTIDIDTGLVMVNKANLTKILGRFAATVAPAAIHPAMYYVCNTVDLKGNREYTDGSVPRARVNGKQVRGYPVPAAIFGIGSEPAEGTPVDGGSEF